MPQSILPPIHPGEILAEEYLAPLHMSAGALARKLDVPRTRIERIVAGQTSISTDTALRLAKFFRTSPEFWMNLQTSHDLKVTARRARQSIAAIEAIPEEILASAYFGRGSEFANSLKVGGSWL